MKVEIELSEIEAFKERIAELEQQKKYADERSVALNEEELIKRAKDLSLRLFNKYIAAIFTSIGFDEPYGSQTVIDEANDHWHSWHKNLDKIKVSVHANVSEQWRRAFLRIGVMSDPKKLNPDEQL